MAVQISKSSQNLRGALKRRDTAPREADFWFTGDGTKTAFTLDKGWAPKRVYDAGALMRPGSGWDYTTSFDGFVWTVTFAVAPANANSICITAEG